MTTLLLRLEGPLQAWSAQGKLGIRDTEREPTKSGVLGFVGAALGMDRDDEATLGELASLSMAVRVDRPGSLLRDYHTAGGGTFRGQQRYFADGTKSCVPTERFYLQDASFLAALHGQASIVRRIASALCAPRWPLFLGRRSCVLSVPPLVGVTEAATSQALRSAPLADRAEPGPCRAMFEVGDAEHGDPRYDVPLSFSQRGRRYGVRYVRTEWISVGSESEGGLS